MPQSTSSCRLPSRMIHHLGQGSSLQPKAMPILELSKSLQPTNVPSSCGGMSTSVLGRGSEFHTTGFTIFCLLYDQDTLASNKAWKKFLQNSGECHFLEKLSRGRKVGQTTVPATTDGKIDIDNPSLLAILDSFNLWLVYLLVQVTDFMGWSLGLSHVHLSETLDKEVPRDTY